MDFSHAILYYLMRKEMKLNASILFLLINKLEKRSKSVIATYLLEDRLRLPSNKKSSKLLLIEIHK
jgi:hypothetical protein